MVGKIQAFGCLVVVAVNKETLENISFLLLTTRSQEAREGRKRETTGRKSSDLSSSYKDTYPIVRFLIA